MSTVMNRWPWDVADVVRFMRHVDVNPEPDDCWLWMGAVNKATGYGVFTLGKRRYVGAHVFSFVAHGGVIGEREIVRHSCDVKPCVAPHHLLGGTYGDNNADARDRGRLRPTGKLSDDDVRLIRALARAGVPHRGLAERFGVHKSAVSHVVTRRNYRGVA